MSTTTSDGNTYTVRSIEGADRVLLVLDGHDALLTHTDVLILALDLLVGANRLGLGRNEGLVDNLLTQVRRAKGECIAPDDEKLLAQRE